MAKQVGHVWEERLMKNRDASSFLSDDDCDSEQK